jgi:hypothetical protein
MGINVSGFKRESIVPLGSNKHEKAVLIHERNTASRRIIYGAYMEQFHEILLSSKGI